MNIKLTDLIYHKENYLSKDECDFLINEYETSLDEKILEHCPDADTGIDTWSSFKKINLIPETEAFNLVHSKNERIINEYHDYLDSFNSFHVDFRKALNYSHQYRLMKYDVGTKIHRHTDHDPFVYGSCTINLNDEYTGGDFCFFKGQHRIKLKVGDILIFPADYFWVHEVEEIKSGVRYSVNSFLMSVSHSVKNNVTRYKDWLIEGYNLGLDEIKNNFSDLKYHYKIKNE
jgi:hypothetical protein